MTGARTPQDLTTAQSKRTLYVLYAVLAAVILGLLAFAYAFNQRVERATDTELDARYVHVANPQPGQVVVLYNPDGTDVFLPAESYRLANSTFGVVESVLVEQNVYIRVSNDTVLVPADFVHEVAPQP